MLVIRTVRLNPPALPTPQGTAAGVMVISPVTQLGVSVVVANEGSVDEPHATVHISMANQTTGSTKTRTLTTAVALGSTVGLPTGHLRGQAGDDLRPDHLDRPAARADLRRRHRHPDDTPGRPGHLSLDPGQGTAAAPTRLVSTARTWWP